MLGTGIGLGNLHRRVGGGGGGGYPAPPQGYDIVVAVGDSLFPARAGLSASDRDAILDAPVANSAQLVNYSAQPDYLAIRTSTAPIYFPDGGNGPYISPLEHFARQYLINKTALGRKVAIVGCNVGGSSLTLSGAVWDPAAPGGALLSAITNSNSALTLFKGLYSSSRIVGIAISLGSNDELNGLYNDATFRSKYLSLVDYLRTNINASSEAWVIAGGLAMSPATGNSPACRASLQYVAANRADTYYVSPPFPTASVDNLHPTQAENRTWGVSMANGIDAAPEPVTVESFSIPSKSGQALNSNIDSAAVIPNVGYGVGTAVSITGGTFSIAGGAFGTTGTYYWGQSIVVRVASSALNNTTTSATLTVGTKTANFDVTTVGAATTNYMRSVIPGALYFDNTKMRSAEDSLVLENA